MKHLALILFIAPLVILGAGCATTPSDSSVTSSFDTSEIYTLALWIIREVSETEIVYSPIEWFTGEQAEIEARKDGCEEGCAPSGFYWRYQEGDESEKVWSLSDSSSLRVKLICNREDCQPDDPTLDGFKSLSYPDYLSADSYCRTTPTDCPYYSIGTGMDFFNVRFSDEGAIIELAEWYVP